MGDLRIRAVEVDEHDAAGELVVDAYRSLGDVGDEFYEPVLRDIVGRVETGEVLVAEFDEEVVGCVTVSFGSTALSEVEDPGAATVRMLGVSSAARGRGIGEALAVPAADGDVEDSDRDGHAGRIRDHPMNPDEVVPRRHVPLQRQAEYFHLTNSND